MVQKEYEINIIFLFLKLSYTENVLDFLSKNVELAKNYSQEMTCTAQISLFFKYVSCSTFIYQNLKKVTFGNNLFETFLLKKKFRVL